MELSLQAHSGQREAKVKCWKGGELVTDVVVHEGRSTGFATEALVKGTRRVSYRDGKRDGEERVSEGGVLKSLAFYRAGTRVWLKEYHPSGKLARYSHTFADGTAELTQHDDGKIYQLACTPSAREEKELRVLCGFEGARTTTIFDGTQKVSRIETWKDGVLQRVAPGDSAYAERSEVAFKDGKKQGTERVLRESGKLERTITWTNGVKQGPEREFAEDGTKLVKETLWENGQTKQVTEYYLNSNPKREERFADARTKLVKEFWDTGKLQREGRFVICESRGYGSTNRNWCEDGVHRAYYEAGERRSEQAFKLGKQHGASKTWWQNGKPSEVEEFTEGLRTKSTRWSEDGKLIADEEFEADGSRKLRR